MWVGVKEKSATSLAETAADAANNKTIATKATRVSGPRGSRYRAVQSGYTDGGSKSGADW
jgi:hypothetical protein